MKTRKKAESKKKEGKDYKRTYWSVGKRMRERKK